MTEEVVIVSKTHMNSAACVGGILKSGRPVRLLDKYGQIQPVDTLLKIGDIYSISYSNKQDTSKS